jgi:hypothetical protein
MKVRLALTAALAAVLLPNPALAQDDEPNPASFAAYFHCNESKESRADEIIEESMAPIFDRHLEAGNITAWGWYAHHTGGHWRRLLYMVGADVPSVVSARDAIIDDLLAEAADATEELTAVCPSHDDYVWEITASSDPGLETGRGGVAMSTYMICDFNEEDRADRIVENVLADIYNKHVEEGTITGWGWLEHNIGGQYRRISGFEAPDVDALLAARSAIFEDMFEEAPIALDRLGEICDSHTDYIWEKQITRP